MDHQTYFKNKFFFKYNVQSNILNGCHFTNFLYTIYEVALNFQRKDTS